MVILTEFSIDILVLSLSSSFDGFLVTSNMNKLEATLKDLVNMLKTYKNIINKDNNVFLLRSYSGTKKVPQNKGDKSSIELGLRVLLILAISKDTMLDMICICRINIMTYKHTIKEK